jgi:pyruvate/2-oxoglutarate dehydrogenase complex dihydrolipoamide acyltransferase (E2) component
MAPAPDRPKARVRPFPRYRRLIVDAGRASQARHPIWGLIEVDVSEARNRIRAAGDSTDERPSFTAFVVSCVARAVAEDPTVHAYRDLFDRLVMFEDVDVNVLIEIKPDVQRFPIANAARAAGRRFPMNHVVRRANLRSVADIGQEIRGVRTEPSLSPSMDLARSMTWLLWLPSWLRARLLSLLPRLPYRQRGLLGTVAVSAIGMAGRGGGWGITFPIHTLTVVVGGIVERPAVSEGSVVVREYVDLTLIFDHDVVDGAPAARFAARLRDLLESASGL